MVEGVTGAGKTSTINALRGLRAFELFDEEATFDDFVSGFRLDRDNAARQARDRMTAILDRIESDLSGSNVLLERFHFSQLALGSEWRWYRDIDDRCAALGVRVGVLFLPVATLESRSLYRAEYDGQDWQDLIGHYGSKTEALAVIARAQSARIEAIAHSRLDLRIVDAAAQDWERYAAELADWIGW